MWEWAWRLQDDTCWHAGLMWGLLIRYRTWWEFVRGMEAGHEGPSQEQPGGSPLIDGRWRILRPLKSIYRVVTLWCSRFEHSCQGEWSPGGCRGGGITSPLQCSSTLWSWLLGEQPLGPWAGRGTSQGLIQLAQLPVFESCKERWHLLLHSFFCVFF